MSHITHPLEITVFPVRQKAKHVGAIAASDKVTKVLTTWGKLKLSVLLKKRAGKMRWIGSLPSHQPAHVHTTMWVNR